MVFFQATQRVSMPSLLARPQHAISAAREGHLVNELGQSLQGFNHLTILKPLDNLFRYIIWKIINESTKHTYEIWSEYFSFMVSL